MFTIFFSEWTPLCVCSRILCSLFLGTIIGIDRGAKRRGGGARTNITVCLGATLVMLLEQYLYILFPNSVNLTRIAAQVVSGVGFLGAGTILVADHHVKGLTSAASIWTSACIGLATGIGMLDVSVLLTLFWLVGLHIVPFIEERAYKHSRYVTLFMEIEKGKAISIISRKLKDDGCAIDTFHVDKPKAKGQNFQIITTFSVPRNVNKDEYINALREMNEIEAVDEM